MTEDELYTTADQDSEQQESAETLKPAAAAEEPPLTTPDTQPPEDIQPAEQEQLQPFSGYEEERPSGEPRHIFLKTAALLTVLAFIAFSVFCIIRDIQLGTTSGGGYIAGNVVEVNLTQHDKPATDDTLTDGSGKYTYAGIAEKVMPSIVEIYTYSDGSIAGTGSGIILSEDGFIATNAHVVSKAESYSIRLFNGASKDERIEATLIGQDSKTDLAILKISAEGLVPATLGDSDQVQLGESVCALGNPAGLSGSITTGIISGMNRRVRASANNFEMDCFQTDAAISPGNSGGALVNMFGQVIGITSSKYSANLFSGSVYEGLGFAITINEALPILTELMEQGYVSGRVRIGISFLSHEIALEQAEKDGLKLPDVLKKQGILVLKIDEDSDLTHTIFKIGDWILTMNGKDVCDNGDITRAIEGLTAGQSVHCRCGHISENGSFTTYEIDFKLLEDRSGNY